MDSLRSTLDTLDTLSEGDDVSIGSLADYLSERMKEIAGEGNYDITKNFNKLLKQALQELYEWDELAEEIYSRII